MKGIMVPLLALVMTTTVVAQQTPTNNQHRAKKQLETPVNSSFLDGLKEYHWLYVNIEEGTDRIVVFSPTAENPTAENLNPKAVASTKRERDDDGNHLIFNLNENEIRNIQERGLAYDYLPGEKFTKVWFKYDTPNRPAPPRPRKQTDAQTNNGLSGGQMTNRRDSNTLNQNAGNTRRNPPQPDEQFGGTINRRNVQNSGAFDPIANRNNQPFGNNRTNDFGANERLGDRVGTNDRIGANNRVVLDPPANNGTNNWDRNNNQNTRMSDFEIARQKILQNAELAKQESQRIELARLRRETEELEVQNRIARNEQDQRLYQEQLRQRQMNAQPNSILPNGRLDPGFDRYASNGSSIINSPYAPIPRPSNEFMNRGYVDNSYLNQRNPTGYQPDLNQQRQRQRLQQEQEAARIAALPKDQGVWPASIEGPENTANSNSKADPKPETPIADRVGINTTDKTNGFLGFLLLCSIGLNVYLLLIARSFYVRYAELADELRETFTSTM